MDSFNRITKLQQNLCQKKQELKIVNEEISQLILKRRKLEEEIQSIKDELKFEHERDSEVSRFDSDQFPWSKELVSKLNSIFKIDQFRSYQKSAINATMSNLDCILIMPTGGGKSLCFQLPAVMSKGVTLVISPLIALMEDQFQGLKALNISSTVLNAQTHKDQSKLIFQQMIDPKSDLKILYVTPERLAKSKRFMAQLEKMFKLGRLVRIVIDECHCCSSWGHDFRPDYKFLGILRNQFPNVPIIGLTATATAKVTIDVQKMLNIEGCLVFKDSFFRENLAYEVYDASEDGDRAEEIANLIKRRFNCMSGIIYCLTISDVENLTKRLKNFNIKCGKYHAQMEPPDRTEIQERWYKNDIQVIIATVAFGMGINKLDVRYVIHYSISKSLENFYQESGRAGRDGKQANCILFFQLGDVFRATSMMMTEKNGIQNVYNMLKYCLDRETCRKGLIAEHFGDSWDKNGCQGMCDNCYSKVLSKESHKGLTVSTDVSGLLRDIVKILVHGDEAEQRITLVKLMNAWFSKGDKKLRVASVKVPSYSKTFCEKIVGHLVLDQYIAEEFHFTPYATISHLVPGTRKLEENSSLNYAISRRSINCSKVKSFPGDNIHQSKTNAEATEQPSKKKLKLV